MFVFLSKIGISDFNNESNNNRAAIAHHSAAPSHAISVHIRRALNVADGVRYYYKVSS